MALPVPKAYHKQLAANRAAGRERSRNLPAAEVLARGYRLNHARAGDFPALGEEKDLVPWLRTEVKRLGLHAHHEQISIGSRRGFPDWTIWGRGRGLIIREVKGSTGRITEKQAEIMDSLVAAGVDAAFWWPEDWHLGIMTETLERLAGVPAAERGRVLKPGHRWCGCPLGALHTCVTLAGQP